ncbi:MAG: GtrA family protein [Acidimicrobiia bacterium]
MRAYLRSFLTKEAFGQFIRLSLIGGLNTLVYFLLLNVFRWAVHVSAFWSITLAFALATAMSYVLNRRWTFQLRDGRLSVRETAWFYLVNVIAWAVTEAIVKGAEAMLGDLGPLELNAANIVATLIILIPKFAGYRDVVFGKALRSGEQDTTPTQ